MVLKMIYLQVLRGQSLVLVYSTCPTSRHFFNLSTLPHEQACNAYGVSVCQKLPGQETAELLLACKEMFLVQLQREKLISKPSSS